MVESWDQNVPPDQHFYPTLRRYEDATGAKINLLKTKGLWVGGWKQRLHDPRPPMDIQWTNTNVEHLGVFFGTADPAKSTFDGLLPHLLQTMTFWKTFYLSKLAKARVLEIFVASKLLYASKFYCMPKPFYTSLQKQFTQFINWPRKLGTVSETEMLRLRPDGGLKLLHLLTKSQASKCAWLVRLVTTPALSLNLNLFTELFGEQPCHKQGLDLLFSPHSYVKSKVGFPSPFYKEALLAFTSLNLQQHVPTAAVTDQLFFYNRIFVDAAGDPIVNPLRGAKRQTCRYYRQFLTEQGKRDYGLLADDALVTSHALMHSILYNEREHAMFTNTTDRYLPLRSVTEGVLYTELLYPQYRLHHSTTKWQELFGFLDWPKIWVSVHNPIANETTKSIIWEQIHLNFDTTYTVNRMRRRADPCSLCGDVPTVLHHILLTCPFVRQLWTDLSPFLLLVHPGPVTDYEMAFGLEGHSPSIDLRNWLTFKLRQIVKAYEYPASLHPNCDHLTLVKTRYNQQIRHEVLWKYRFCLHTQKLDLFRRLYQWGNHHLVDVTPDELGVAVIFDI